MATTPNGYPYVAPADHPLEFPASSQQLANVLDTRVGPATTTGALVVYGGWTLVSSQVERRNGWVAVRGVLSKSTAPAAGEQIAWLPTGYNPTMEWFGYAFGAVASGGGHKIYIVSVDVNNSVKIRGSAMPAAAEQITISMVYPI